MPSFGAIVVTLVRVVTVQAFHRSLAAVSPGRHGRHPLPRQSHADPRRGGGRH